MGEILDNGIKMSILKITQHSTITQTNINTLRGLVQTKWNKSVVKHQNNIMLCLHDEIAFARLTELIHKLRRDLINHSKLISVKGRVRLWGWGWGWGGRGGLHDARHWHSSQHTNTRVAVRGTQYKLSDMELGPIFWGPSRPAENLFVTPGEWLRIPRSRIPPHSPALTHTQTHGGRVSECVKRWSMMVHATDSRS